MAANILAALGAAMQTGSRTYGQLKDQERLRQQQEDYFNFQRQNADRQFGLQKDQFQFTQDRAAADDQQRVAQRIQNALMMAEGDTPFDSEFVSQVREHTPELSHLMNIRPQLNVQDGGAMLAGVGGDGPATSEVGTKRVGLQEQLNRGVLADRQMASGNTRAFQEWLQQNPNASAQERFETAQRFGQQFGGLSPDEQRSEADRVGQQAHQRRLAELSVTHPPDRFASNPAMKWLDGRNSLGHRVQQKYNSELQSKSIALRQALDAGDMEVAGAMQQEINRIQQQIEQETDALATRILGAMPGEQAPQAAPAGDPTEDLVASIDAVAQAKFGGNYDTYQQEILNDQAELRAAGVDVPRLLREIRERAAQPQVAPPTTPEAGGGASFPNLQNIPSAHDILNRAAQALFGPRR